MCGLFFAHNAKLSLEKLLFINGIMRHRGPDSRGHFYQVPFFLGFNRLSILDLSSQADQPFKSLSGKHVIIFNGEIYNYRELVKKYQLQMRTSGDTELVIELYEKHGEKILGELNGMFAMVILNLATNVVFVARDRLGVKPLYIYNEGGTLAIASEVAPLLELSDNTEIDGVGLRQYKKIRTFFNGHTLYKKVSSFPAGHYYKDGRFTRYWDLPVPTETPPTDADLFELIKSSVGYRCVSDVPVASFLSGGLDSSIVALLAKPTRTWSIGFADSNEFAWADKMAHAAGTRHQNITVTDDEFMDTAKYMIRERREPLSVPNEVLLYLASKEIKKETKVVLCGEGADELFWGYDRVFRWAAGHATFDLKQFDQLYSYSKNDDLEILDYAIQPFVKTYQAPLNIVSAFFQIAHLHGLLRRLDHSTMRASIEAREPFVDYRLVEKLFGLGLGYKIQDGVVKAPLKRIFKSLLPVEILERPKVGFPVPLERIFKCKDRSAAFDAWFDFNLNVLGIEI